MARKNFINCREDEKEKSGKLYFLLRSFIHKFLCVLTLP